MEQSFLLTFPYMDAPTGTGKSDSIPAMLSDGEFVMTSKAVKGMGGGNREAGFKKLNTMMKSAEGRAV